jgi:hypothetical protein
MDEGVPKVESARLLGAAPHDCFLILIDHLLGAMHNHIIYLSNSLGARVRSCNQEFDLRKAHHLAAAAPCTT